MTAALPGKSRRRREGSLRKSAPFAYLAAAMAAAVLAFPTALRPPPDPTTESGAISPDAPPENSPEQLLVSQQQAGGGGAGAGPGGSATTTTMGAVASAPATTIQKRASSAGCFGKPPRQAPTVYAAACAPSFSGDNGGVTGHNVFANEVRLGFQHVLSIPSDGRIDPNPTSPQNAVDRTMRVLEVYVNKHFETYGRRVAFYGLPVHGNPEDSAAAAQTADKTHKLFGGYDLGGFFAKDAVRMGQVWFTDPQQHSFYLENRPGFFSWQMDFDQAFGFGSEYLCKQLKDRTADFAGGEVKGKPRRFGIVSEYNGTLGIPADNFVRAYRKECNGELVNAITIPPSSPNDAAAAIQRLRLDGATTILLNVTLDNGIALMAAATPNYLPEWILLANEGLDFNQAANLFPKEQSSQVFGISAWEVAKPPAQTECSRAYKEIDPDNDPDDATCTVFWHPMITLMNGIQVAGPKLSQKTFEAALFKIGYRYEQTIWAIGGGYGPDDYSYMDSVGEIWWDNAAINPETGGPGAFHWTFGGARWKRGQARSDSSRLFREGITVAPEN